MVQLQTEWLMFALSLSLPSFFYSWTGSIRFHHIQRILNRESGYETDYAINIVVFFDNGHL